MISLVNILVAGNVCDDNLSMVMASFFNLCRVDTKAMIHPSWQMSACFGKSKAAMYNYKGKLNRPNQWVLNLLGSQNKEITTMACWEHSIMNLIVAHRCQVIW